MCKDKNEEVTFIKVNSKIDVNLFFKLKEILETAVPKPTLLRINSVGGTELAGEAIGKLITENEMDVEVMSYCISACANQVFLRGKNKILSANALVVFHGDATQENINQQFSELKDSFENGGSAKGEGKEVVVSYSIMDERTREMADYINYKPPTKSFSEFSQYQIKRWFAYLDGLGINREIAALGQRGKYKGIYESRKFWGFYYSPETLAKLGVENIILKDGTWDPQGNPLIADFYEVNVD